MVVFGQMVGRRVVIGRALCTDCLLSLVNIFVYICNISYIQLLTVPILDKWGFADRII